MEARVVVLDDSIQVSSRFPRVLQKPKIEDAVTTFAAGSDRGFQDVRSYINSLAYSPDGMTVVASMEGSNAVVVVPQNQAKYRRKWLRSANRCHHFDRH